jgi:hypothetical protein
MGQIRSNPQFRLVLSILLPAIGAGLFLTLLDGKTAWMSGWLAYTTLVAGVILVLYLAVQKLGISRRINRLAWVTFWLRLGLGALWMSLLPVLGYPDNPYSDAGYLYQDAYYRDHNAWALAASDQPVWQALGGTLVRDQYGGMMAMSAATYRFFSPEFHRPRLVLVWLSLAGALATLFLWRGLVDWLPDNSRVADLAAFIFALYPEAVLLGTSHMREAVVLLGICLIFYGYVRSNNSIAAWSGWTVLGVLILLPFQAPLAVVAVGITFGLWLLEPDRRFSWRILIGFGILGLLTYAAMFFAWRNLPSLQHLHPSQVVLEWLRLNFGFQSHLTERASGMMQKLLSTLGERWWLPVVLGYGSLQPVLPATIVDPAIPLWRVLNSIHAVGWYMLFPVLGYSILATLNPAAQPRRWQRLWIGLACLVWILVAAANAGGDQWDNPRYRTLFLPWMALLAAWGWFWARQRRDPWLWRLGAVVVLFVVLFLEWYISRYSDIVPHLNLETMLILTVTSAGLFLVSCIVWDVVQKRRGK